MSTTLAVNVIADAVASYVATADMGRVSYPAYLKTTYSLSEGSGNLQADTLWADTRQLAGLATETFVTTNGSLTTAFGDAITLAIIKLVYIKSSDQNLEALEYELTLGSDTHTGMIPPGGVYLICCPSATGYTAGDITITAGTNGATYSIYVVGVST